MLQRAFVVLIALVFSLGVHARGAAPAAAACPASSASVVAAPLAKFKATPAPVLKPNAAQGQAAILAARLLTRFQYDAVLMPVVFIGFVDGWQSVDRWLAQRNDRHRRAGDQWWIGICCCHYSNPRL